MAIIYTYPVKSVPVATDLILISDSQDSNKTKQVAVSTLPGGSGSGTSSVTSANVAITVANPTSTPILTSVAYTGGTNIGHVPTGSGSSASVYLDGSGSWSTPASSGGPGTGTANSIPKWATSSTLGDSNIVDDNSTVTFSKNIVIKGDGSAQPGKLKLRCYDNASSHHVELLGPVHAGAASYSLQFPNAQSTGTQILQADSSGLLSWIATPSSGGGGSVDSVNTTDGTFVNLTPNSATTGAVTVTADLSATGTAGNTTFLRGDNQWVTPTNTTYNAMTTSTLGLGKLRYTTGSTPAAETQSVTANRTYGVTANDADQLVVNVPWVDTNTAPVDSVSAGTSGASSGSALTVSPTTGAVKVTSNSYAGTTNVGHVPTGGSNTTFLRGDGTWVVPTNTTSIALTTTGTSGASTWNGTTLNIPQYSGGGGSGASLGFAPLEIYSANTVTTASYIYYMVAVCDVDFTVNKCKVAVTSGTGPIYVTVYSMDYGSLQTSTLTKLGAFNNSASIAGVNEISLTESAFSLTAGQTICIGVGTANTIAAAAGINNTDLGVMVTSGGGAGALPATPDFESLGTANKRPAIHFYAS